MVPVKLVTLFIILLFYSPNGVDSSVSVETQILLLKNEILQQNAKISEQNTKIADQSTKIAEQNTKIAELNIKLAEQCDFKDRVENLESNVQNYSGASLSSVTGTVFTRWGRTDCPQTVSDLVYSGTVGGSWYEHSGAAVNYLCLTPDPLWDINKHFNGPSWGYIYGGEYQDLPNSNLYNYNPPCAVCRSTSYSTMIMIPGRNKCYVGWTEAYHGELVSGRHMYQAASEYVCLDIEAQINGKNSNENGVLMYPVRYKCGSLPCPPYENDKLATCVVCLK